LDSARVQAPISHFAVELWNHGPRVPLLDRLGVAHDWQGLAVLAWLLGLAFTAARLLRWKSQRTG
jgi:hypothetical protein